MQTDKTNSLEILVSDYFSPSFFPHTAISPSAPLVQGFISSARVKDLVGLYKLNILQKLVPGLRKDGYQDDSEYGLPFVDLIYLLTWLCFKVRQLSRCRWK